MGPKLQSRRCSLTTIRLARLAMGTRFELLLCGEGPVFLRAAGEEALEEVERLEAQLSRYRADSEVSGINARAALEPVAVEPQLFALFERIARLWEATEGAFDPTIGPLMACWGLSGAGASTPEPRRPEPEALAAARARVGFQHVRLDPTARTIRFLRPGMELDLGAIGKGYAIERAAALLAEAGVTAALLHGGTSTVYGLGAPPDADAWTVAVRDPRAEEGERLLARVRLRDRALSVSAPHGKSFVAGGLRYGHVLDPRRGEPVRAALLAAVASGSPTDADALSTALLVLGIQGRERVLAYDPGCRGLLVPADAPSERDSFVWIGESAEESFASPAEDGGDARHERRPEVPVRLYDKATGSLLAELSADQLASLQDALEEEFLEDQDYYLTADTLEYLKDEGLDAGLVERLQAALGEREGFDVLWRVEE